MPLIPQSSWPFGQAIESQELRLDFDAPYTEDLVVCLRHTTPQDEVPDLARLQNPWIWSNLNAPTELPAGPRQIGGEAFICGDSSPLGANFLNLADADRRNLDALTAVTFAFWIRVPSLANNNNGNSLYHEGTNNTDGRIAFETSGRVRSRIGGQNTNTAGGLIQDGVWHHVVQLWAQGDRRQVWVDGALGVTNSGSSSLLSFGDTSDGITLGASDTSGTGSTDITEFDDFRIYANRALVEHEIREIYQNPNGIIWRPRRYFQVPSGTPGGETGEATDKGEFSDESNRIGGHLRTSVDGLTGSDESTGIRARLGLALDGMTVGDSAIGLEGQDGGCVDKADFSDSATAIRGRIGTAQDGGTFSDESEAAESGIGQAEDGATFSDSAIGIRGRLGLAGDGVIIADGSAGETVGELVGFAVDGATFSDQATGRKALQGICIDGATFSDSAQRRASRLGLCVDGLRASDIATYPSEFDIIGVWFIAQGEPFDFIASGEPLDFIAQGEPFDFISG